MQTLLLLQTRAFTMNPETARTKLADLGFKAKGKSKLRDIYFCESQDLNPESHTYEKHGETLRIRISNGNLKVQQHIAVKFDKKGKAVHDIFKLITIFDGNSGDLAKAKELAFQKGYPHLLLEIKKQRDQFQKDDLAVVIDYLEVGSAILEIHTKLKSEKDYKMAKKQHFNLLDKLELTENLISDGYTHRKITAYIRSNPDLRKKLLKEEFEKLKKKLRQKEKISGEAYRDTGDGWHENPTYEAIVNDMYVLNNRLIDIKKELAGLKRSR